MLDSYIAERHPAVLTQLDRADAASAQHARQQAEVGTTVAMLLLLAVFGYFYFRARASERRREEDAPRV